MRERSPPSPRFASFRADTAVTTVADASTTADVYPVVGHIRLMIVRRLQLFLRVFCDVRNRTNELVGSDRRAVCITVGNTGQCCVLQASHTTAPHVSVSEAEHLQVGHMQGRCIDCTVRCDTIAQHEPT